MVKTLDLPAVHKAIQGLDEDGIVKLANEAASAEHDGWFARARAIGELQRRARYKDAVVAAYAKRLKISRSTAFDLGAIDRDILLPRLREQGDAARFPIKARRFYSCAVKLGPLVGRKALAVIEVAEQQREKNPRFSTRALREHFGVPAPASRRSNDISRCLATISHLDTPARRRFARSLANRDEVVRLAEATARNARALAEELRTTEVTRG